MKWQDGYDEKKTILNVRLSKIIGLYQILDPEDLSVRGYNVYRAMAAVMLVFEAVVLVLSVTGVYYWMGSQSYSVTQLGNSTNILCTLYKMWILIRQPERIRDCLRVAGEDFMASGGCGTAGFRRARAKALFVTSCYVTMGFMILFLYSVTPYVYSNNYLMLKGPDGERQAYHLSVFNLYFPVSTAAYNRYFTVFHAIEIMFGLVWVIYSHVFDLFAITMCFSISNQLKTIGIAFATLGRKTIENRDSNKSEPEKKAVMLDNLKTILTDHQNVLAKTDEFFDIVRSIVLAQLVISSQSVVFILFIIILESYNGVENYLQTSKLYMAIPFFLFQLFLTCYIFECIHKEKDATLFAVYSSNWEDMDMESKKLVLLTMNMNSAHNVRMKVTRMRVVNMEIFANAIRMCYSVLSVMVNANIK